MRVEYLKRLSYFCENNKNFSPLLYFPDIQNKNTLVVTFNPSNSYFASRYVIDNLKKSENANIKNYFNEINNQSEFNGFLSKDNIEEKKEYIQIFQANCHKHHPFFKKRSFFLNHLGYDLNLVTYIDMFPFWCIEQNELNKILKKNRNQNKKNIKKSIEYYFVSLFIDIIKYYNPSNIVILNKGVYNILKYHKKIEKESVWKLGDIDKTIHIEYKKLKVHEGLIHSSNLFCIGIGRFDAESQLSIFAEIINKKNLKI